MMECSLVAPSFWPIFASKSQRAAKVVDYSYRMLTSLMRLNRYTYEHQGMVMLTNCVVMMVSPPMYQDRLLAYDQRIYDLCTQLGFEFGIHHCGVFDKYAAAYRQIPRVSWIEIGWDSDIKAALELFPEATVQYIFSAQFMATADRTQVQEKTRQILDAARGNWHRFRLPIPDIDHTTPDDNLVEVYECCKHPDPE